MKTFELQRRVLKTIMSFEVAKGHLKWKLTDVARTVKVQRTLIYYHFGNTKAEVFTRCLELVANEFYGLSPERMNLILQGRGFDCLLESRRFHLEVPEFMIFYSRWRTKPSTVQTKLIDIERRYREKLHLLFPGLSDSQLVSLHSLIQGLVSSPVLSEAGFLEALKLINFPAVNRQI